MRDAHDAQATHGRTVSAGKRILFWDQVSDGGGIQSLLGRLGRAFAPDRACGQPQDHVRPDVPWVDREEVIRALQPRSTVNPHGGDVLVSHLGWANCRICGEPLGTRDFFGHGFVWPEMADHYLDGHRVWTPGCDELLAAVRWARRVRRRIP